MGRRSPCCKKEVLKRGPWTTEEDKILMAYIQQHGHGSWRALPEKAGLQRCGKSCRLRWINYLRPDIKRGKFSLQEEQTIIQLHALLGNRWSAMAAHLPKRTDNEIKNHWNTHLKKRLMKMGIDPMTHKPRTNASSFQSGPGKNNASNLSHMAQWESARLEAEARLVRESKMLAPTPIQVQVQVQPETQFPRPAASTQLVINNNNAAAAATPGRPRCLDVLKAWQGVVAGMFGFPCTQPDLGSPTSTLSSPDGTIRAPVINGLTTGYPHNLAMELGFHEKSNRIQQELEERLMIGSYVGLHDGMTDATVDADGWLEDSFRVGNNIGHQNSYVPIANIMEGLSDALILNSGFLNCSSIGVEEVTDQSCNDDVNMMENRSNCWDSVLNLVNSSPYGSPVF